MDLQLNGRKVLVTGASRGIGEGLAHAFAAEGCALYLTARAGDDLARVAQAVRDRHGALVRTLALDMTAPGAPEQVAAFSDDADVLVNNAGAIPGGSLWEVDEAAWRRGWELKVFGYINLTRLVYARMKASGGGVILNNIGNGGENYDFDYIAGTTGNAALMAFTRALGGRSLQDGIRVLGVNPGPVDTERIRKVLRQRGDRSDTMAGMPLGRPASVQEVADLFVYLASSRSGYSSGAIFTVDGGLTSRRSIV
ncbi:SDR family oxidoreductase [Xylophilus sp. ASV27]|uniref:SDR family oxidoreductase n=1 Tax=Xylophilus sp. ASV27 TaxID=2795129 RepID=UPI0018ECB13B|nr:SDR family oxidoreductase [Xylophilus sp. ASV27]